MKSIFKKPYVAIVLIVLLAVGCRDYFEELQKNPNSPTKAGIPSVLAAATYNQLNREGGYGTGMIGVFTQHYAGNHANGIDYDQYVIDPDTGTGYMRTAYPQYLRDYKYVIEEGTKSKSFHYVGVAKIMTGFGLLKITEIFGDIPWSEALDITNDTPKYDSQKSIYDTGLKMIGEGIADLDKSSVVKLSQGDIMYGGDVKKWKAVAYAMQARYLNVLGKSSEALAAVKKSKAAGFSRANTFKVPYDGTQEMGDWWWMVQNSYIIASKLFMDYLVKENDPRKEAFFSNDNDGNNVGWTGKPNGYGVDNKSFSPTGPYFADAKAYGIILPYYELLFIEAETALKEGDKAAAATALNAAVKESVDAVTTHKDGIARKAAYFKAYASFTAANVDERHIMTEKWKAMHCLEPETWTDMRRYGFQYPIFKDGSKPKFHVKKDGTKISDKFIQRLLYPQSELDRNPQPVQKEVNIFSKMIFSKK